MKNIVIAGGGVLGSQIGFQSAYRGKNVTFWLRSEETIGRAKPKIEKLYMTYLAELDHAKAQIGKEKPDYARALIEDFENTSSEEIDKLKEDVKKAYESIKYEADLAKAMEGADFVIEAIAEVEDVKHDFFKKIKDYLGEDTILASNSSTMIPSTFKDDAGRPENYLHFHFANHIWRNNLAEIMVTPETSDKAREAVEVYAKEITMIPVVIKKERPGYLLNSLLVPLLSAAQELVAGEYASFEDVDMAWKVGAGAPRGPFEILDIVGLMTPYNLAKYKEGADDPSTMAGKIVKMLEEKIQAGKTGVAAGEGFYKYDEKSRKIN